MKKLFAGIITCATILLTGIGVPAAAADENNSGDENVQSEIAFCIVNSEQTGRTAYSYGGFFIESNGNVRTFSFENIEDDWTLIWGSDYYNDDNTVSLDGSMPYDKLLSRLNDNISEYKIVGNISEEEYASKASLLSEINLNAEIPFVPVKIAGMTSYTESFGVRYDNDNNAQIVFMNGHVSGDMKYRTYLENPDEKSIELNNWLIEKCRSFISPELITTTTPDATTTTTVTTTEVKPNTESSKNENEQSEIVFVWNSFDECYAGNTDNPPESYKGFFVEKNGNIRSFSFEYVNEHWTFGYVSMEDIPKTISLNQTTPQENLLSHLTDVSKYQIVGKISEKELNRYLNLLSDINTNVDIEREFCPELVVRGYSETFGLRYDDNGNAEVVFLNGMGTIINKHTDENALEIDSWLRNLDISSDNPNTETTQPNPTENTTTTTVTTTITSETNTEQTTESPTTDEGGSVTTETSTVPPTTTTGTETTLPQTGYSKWYQALIAAAMGMIGVGSTAIVRSGIFRKKENNS